MKLKRQFRGVPKGKIYPVTYGPGDTVPPELVAAAKAVGADQDPPERPESDPVQPQSVAQMGANGKVGRSGGGKRGGKKDENTGGPEVNEADAAQAEADDSANADPAEADDGSGAQNADNENDDGAGGPADPALAGLG